LSFDASHHLSEWPYTTNAKKHSFSTFLFDESGNNRAIEYGLIAVGIALAIIAAFNGLGTNLNNVFRDVQAPTSHETWPRLNPAFGGIQGFRCSNC
jgi:pilus assembly protein Flp/PilA